MSDAPEVRPLHGPVPAELERFLRQRVDRALLVLGDLAAPLRPHTSVLVARDQRRGGDAVTGCAVRFDGFSQPVISVVADQVALAETLLDRVCESGALLAGHESEPIVRERSAADASADAWLKRSTAPFPTAGVVPLDRHDVDGLRTLYAAAGTGFWTPAMLDFGHFFGIRDSDAGNLVSAAGVSFVLPGERYGQIGNLATLPAYRRRGAATRCLLATIGSLRAAGIGQCGVFADGGTAWLADWYARLGFAPAGRYRFIDL